MYINLKAKEMMKACKHLTDTSADGHPEMFEMVSKLFEHDAKVLDIKSAMCNMMSDACKEKRVISDVRIFFKILSII